MHPENQSLTAQLFQIGLRAESGNRGILEIFFVSSHDALHPGCFRARPMSKRIFVSNSARMSPTYL